MRRFVIARKALPSRDGRSKAGRAMRKRWIGALVLALAAVAAYAGPVRATDPTPRPCFSSETLSKGTFGRISLHVQTQVPQFWNAVVQTVGDSDLFVQRVSWNPGVPACNGLTPSSGWHMHPGPSFITVTAGTVTVYRGDDPDCTPHVYTAGNTFMEIAGVVHIVRNEDPHVPAQTIAVQLIPNGADRRMDADDPGNCHFSSP
jgi:Cupin domain